MEIFNVVVGAFSIIGSIAAIIGMGVSINIRKHIINNSNINSDNAKNVTQQSRGKNNININRN